MGHVAVARMVEQLRQSIATRMMNRTTLGWLFEKQPKTLPVYLNVAGPLTVDLTVVELTLSNA